jgi:hypothetical protein
VFWRGSNGDLMHMSREAGTTVESKGKPPNNTGISAPSAVAWGPNRFDVFARGSDNQLWHLAYNGSNWVDWVVPFLFPPASSGPSLVSWGPSRLDLFWLSSGHLRHSGTDDGISWTAPDDWAPPPGVTLDNHPPAAVSWENGRLDVVVAGTDGNLYHKFGGTWGFSDWFSPTQYTGWPANVLPGSVSMASWGTNVLQVFFLTTSHTLGHCWWDGVFSMNWGCNDWGAPPGVTLTKKPAQVSWGPFRIDVYVGGSDGKLWQRAWDHGLYDWAPVSTMSEVGTAGAAVSWAAGQLDVYFGANNSNQLIHWGYW